jgi:cysteine dioxygenase
MYSIPTLTTFEQLIKVLHAGPGYDGYSAILASIELEEGELEKKSSWSPDGYARIILERIPSYELLLACWEPGQIGPIHDYNGQESWFRVLQGELTEELFSFPIESGKALSHRAVDQVYQAGNLGYINDGQGLHRLRNASNERVISIHLHVCSLNEVNLYDEFSGAKETLNLGIPVEK